MNRYTAILLSALTVVGCNTDTGENVDEGGGIDDALLAPQVIWTDPPNNAVGPNIMSPNNTVKIRFNKLMNTRPVIHSVSIDPSNSTVYVDTNSASPVEGTTFDFPLTPTPDWRLYVLDSFLDRRFPPGYLIYYPSFKVAQKYTITVDTSAQDINGNYLYPKYIFSFTPEPYFRVTDTYPKNNDTSISPLYLSISVRFNAIVDTSTARSSFSISPPVPGTIYLNKGSWGFYWLMAPYSTLGSETTYTVAFGAAVKDEDGHTLPSVYSFSLRSAAYAAVSGYPTGVNVSRSSTLTVSCNFFIDSTTVAPSFSIMPSVGGTFQYNLTSFQYVLTTLLAQNTEYTVTVSKSLRSMNGVAVKNPYTFTFKTGN